MPKRLRLAALLAFAASAAAAADPLIGLWEKDGAPYSEVRADHTATVGPDKVRWATDGRTLTLTYGDGRKERMSYVVDVDSLTVFMDGESETYTRGKPRGKSVKATSGKAGNDKLSALLLSSPWCHFRYNKISGSSNQERVVFRRDGTWDSGKRGETYSSGAAGTVSGQSDSSAGGRWAVKGEVLLLSEGAGPLQDSELKVTRNSNGYPILNSGGKEYSSCN